MQSGDRTNGERLRELRRQTGMNRRVFAEYFGIPYRTVQDWELGSREMPEYLLRLMIYKSRTEGLDAGGGAPSDPGAEEL